MDQLKCHKNIGARTHAELTSFLKIETVLTYENPTKHVCVGNQNLKIVEVDFCPRQTFQKYVLNHSSQSHK
jgi:hypothetical protein